jgi:hypothetical protein
MYNNIQLNSKQDLFLKYNNMDFRFAQINRIIMHKILGKSKVEDARAELKHKLIVPNDEVVALLKVRLTDACGKQSNSFISEIDDPSKFLSKTRLMKNGDDTTFIEVSQNIAKRLAHYQTSRNMKSGNLLILDGIQTNTSRYFAIVIKAEYDNVMNTVEEGEDLQIQILQEVFLSKNQKLFKIGILYEKSNDIPEGDDYNPNEFYSTIVFDENIKSNGPAEYFYKEFLGYKLDSNEKIRTEKFYNKSLDFIKDNISDSEKRCDAVNKLVSFLKNEQAGVMPNDYKNIYLPEDLRDLYETTVQNQFPHAFTKDNELIKSRLKNRKVTFKGGVYLYAPADDFEQHIRFINSNEELNQLSIEPQNTIVQIYGKPYSNE